jgi:hypothetical protein
MNLPASGTGAAPYPSRTDRSALTYADPVLLPPAQRDIGQQRFTATLDGQLHPFGGLYAELLQPSRITAIYGELTLTTFRNKGVFSYYDYSTGLSSYTPFSYQAVLGTARIGIRYFAPLAHDRQLVFGLGFERNIVWGMNLPASGTGAAPYPSRTDRSALTYADPVLLPNITLGWRQQRFTATLDGQLYTSSNGGDGVSTLFFGTNVAARFGLSYRLGSHPDQARAR